MLLQYQRVWLVAQAFLLRRAVPVFLQLTAVIGAFGVSALAAAFFDFFSLLNAHLTFFYAVLGSVFHLQVRAAF